MYSCFFRLFWILNSLIRWSKHLEGGGKEGDAFDFNGCSSRQEHITFEEIQIAHDNVETSFRYGYVASFLNVLVAQLSPF